MTGIWRVWLRAWCVGVIVFGLFLTTAAIPAADGALRWLIGVMNTNDAAQGSLDMNFVRFGIGLSGALTLGWGMTLLAVFSQIGADDTALWRSLTLAAVVWYAIDSAISVMTGFALNAASNTVLIALYLVPVLASGVLRGRGEPRASLA